MAGASRNLVVNLIGNTKLGALQAGMAKFGAAAAHPATIVTAALAGLGVAAFKLGESFDEAYDNIRLGTGATGDALEDLKDSFKNVARQGPSSFDEVSTAIADINTRLGLTGKPLEAVSDQFLDLSRITKTDLAGNITSITRLFGDWDVATRDMTGTMDEMFRAAQTSGVGVDTLGDRMVQFGAPLRQMGFGFSESLALFSKFEREGVNMEAVMQGMRTGLGKMAKAGEKAPETFRRVSEEIAAMEDPTEATGVAIELFGQRAGPDMAAAIREGRFDIEEYIAAIEGGEDTIQQAAKDTDDWREKLATLKNKVLIGLEPLATKLFDGLNKGLDKVLPLFEKLAPAIGPAFSAIGAIAKVVLAPMVLAFSTIGKLIAKFSALWEAHGAKIMATLKPVTDFIQKTFARIEALFFHLNEMISALIDGDWAEAWSRFKKILIVVGRQIMDTIRTFGPMLLAGLKALGGVALKGLQALGGLLLAKIEDLPAALGDLGGLLLQKGKDLLRGLRDGAEEIWGNFTDWLGDRGTQALLAVPSLLESLKSRGKQLLNGLRNGAEEIWEKIKTWLGDRGSQALVAVPSLLGSLKSRGKQLLNGLRNGAEEVWDKFKDWLGDRGSQALGAVPGMLRWLKMRGKQLLWGLRNGAKEVWGAFRSWLGDRGTDALLAVPSLLESLKSRGRQLLNGLRIGAEAVWDTFREWLGGRPAAISGAIGGAVDGVIGSLEGIGGRIGDAIVRGFRAAFQKLIDVYNNTLGRIPGMPTIGGGGSSGHGPVVRGLTADRSGGFSGSPQKLHSGGVVPGGPNTELPFLLQGGETVRTRRQEMDLVAAMGRNGAKAGDTIFNVDIHMPPGSNGNDVVRALREYERRQGPIPISVR